MNRTSTTPPPWSCWWPGPANFNAEIGRQIARENAVDKVWPLMGYELRSKLARDLTPELT